MSERNLALLLTPPGSAAIAVVRLMGPCVPEFLRAHFSKPAIIGRCIHGNLTDDGEIIDDPVVVMAGDGLVADINLHGGAWVVRSALELARRNGFHVLDKLNFPLPHDAVDAIGIESHVLAAIPLASTELALRRLLEQPAAWEAVYGLGGEDPARDEFRREISRILADRSLEHLLHPPRVAIVGAPNVGKSTLANQLFAQERSITADMPGTTRDWVGEIANLDGLAVLLVDTPGIRDTADPIEAEAIRRSAGEVTVADLIVLVLDATRSLEGEQRELLTRFQVSERVTHVANKCDRPMVWEPAAAMRTSAISGMGIDALRAVIRERFGCDAAQAGRAAVWTKQQREALRRVGENPLDVMQIFET